MEDIRIYHSIWKNVINMLVVLAFSALGVSLILNGKGDALVWIVTILFALCALMFLYPLVRERITGTPYLVITDKSLVLNSGSKSFEIPFADVDSFRLTGIFGVKMIGIRYTKEAEAEQSAEASAAVRMLGKCNEFIAGVPGALPASDLTIRPRVIIELLNERLEAFRKN